MYLSQSLPSLVQALDAAIRQDLQNCRDSYFSWLLISTAVVAIGVAMEGPELVYETIRIFRHKCLGQRSRPVPDWVTLIALLGWGFVVLGVAGEGVAEGLVSRADATLQSFNDILLGGAIREAGAARVSAESAAVASSIAQKKVREVAIEADALTARIGSASKHLGDLEQDMLAQGPRWRLLHNGEAAFVKALEPFAGQRVTVVTCANDDSERWKLEQMLISTSFPRAGWGKPDGVTWHGCPILLTGGNEIYFVSSAIGPDEQWAKPTCGRFSIPADAGDALCDVMNQLKISTGGWKLKTLPEEIGVQNARSFFGNGIPDGPAEMAYKDPGRIFLLIGPAAPMFANNNKLPHKNATPK